MPSHWSLWLAFCKGIWSLAKHLSNLFLSGYCTQIEVQKADRDLKERWHVLAKIILHWLVQASLLTDHISWPSPDYLSLTQNQLDTSGQWEKSQRLLWKHYLWQALSRCVRCKAPTLHLVLQMSSDSWEARSKHRFSALTWHLSPLSSNFRSDSCLTLHGGRGNVNHLRNVSLKTVDAGLTSPKLSSPLSLPFKTEGSKIRVTRVSFWDRLLEKGSGVFCCCLKSSVTWMLGTAKPSRQTTPWQ